MKNFKVILGTGLVCFLYLLASCKTTEPSDSNQNSLSDSTVITNNNDGTFKIFCKDGTSEIKTEIELLKNPNQVCGGSMQSICTSKGYAGSTIDQAIDRCQSRGGLDLNSCTTAVICSSNIQFCTSKRYAGSTIDQAIERCRSRGGHDLNSCSTSVSCSSNIQFCTSKGHAGSTIDEAIDRCRSRGGLDLSSCTANVNCL